MAATPGAGNESTEPDDVLGDFVHDIRNPISAIVGFSDLLMHAHDKMTDDQRRKAVEALNRTAKRLSDMVDGFAGERATSER